MTQSTLYGVFMLRHGTWQLLETYNCKATAEQNVKYVGEVLGLPSKLMIRDLDSPATHTATFGSGAQSVCLQETRIGEAPSYVELITCLELDKQAAEASIENRKALQTPKSP
jgi:hypothetical protein